jgi:type IV secretion system protein VirB1
VSAAALSLSAFMALAAECAPAVAPETLAAIARVEADFNPLAIGVNGRDGGPVRASSREEAAAKARALIAAGRSIDLGIMQINDANLRWLGLAVEDAFDPCRSIAAGAHVLRSYSAYNTGNGQRGFANGYVSKVVASGRANAAAPVPRTGSASPSVRLSYDPGGGEPGQDFSYATKR